MKYFICFDEEKKCKWECKSDNVLHPQVVNGAKVIELSKKQYELSRFLELVDNKPSWKQPKYQEYLDKQKTKLDDKTEKAEIKAKISEIKEWNTTADIDFTLFKKILIRLLKKMKD